MQQNNCEVNIKLDKFNAIWLAIIKLISQPRQGRS